MKQRVAVIRLWSGSFLTPAGTGEYGHGRALRLRVEDGRRLLKTLRTREHGDILWGASLELLPKRGRQPYASEADFQQFFVTMRTVRLQREAARLTQAAEGYRAQARHADEMAAQTLAKADAIRAELSKPQN